MTGFNEFDPNEDTERLNSLWATWELDQFQ